MQDSPRVPGVVETKHTSPRDQERSRHLLQKPMGGLHPTPPPASPTAAVPGSPSHPLEMGTVELHACQGLGKENQDAPTHVDLEDGGAHGGVLEEADVVQGLAENGAVVVLVDEVNLHTRKANVVWDALVCKELGRDGKRRGRLETLFAKLGRVIFFNGENNSLLSSLTR